MNLLNIKIVSHHIYEPEATRLEREVYSSLVSTNADNGWQRVFSEHGRWQDRPTVNRLGVEILYNSDTHDGRPVLAIKGMYRCNQSADYVSDFICNVRFLFPLC